MHAVVCCDYLVCGSALLLTIIAFCKNCINHVVTIQKKKKKKKNPPRWNKPTKEGQSACKDKGRGGGEQGTRGSE